MSQFNFADLAAGNSKQLSVPASRTSTVTGSAIDILPIRGKALVVQDVGAVTGTTPTLNGKLQDSADGSTDWTDIAGAVFAEVTAANKVECIPLNVDNCRRYVRWVGTLGGTTPNFTVGVTMHGFVT